MKKILLSVALIAAGFVSNAQALLEQDFNSFTIGNLSEDVTGAQPGQGPGDKDGGKWFTFAASGATTADFQIEEIVAGDNALVLTGSDLAIPAQGQPSRTRYTTTYVKNAWGARDKGNDFVRMSVNFFSGSASDSHNQFNACFFDGTGKIIAGFRYLKETNTLVGTYYKSLTGGTGTYFVNLGPYTQTTPPEPVVLNDGEWYNFVLIYDKTSGDIEWYVKGYDTATKVNNSIKINGTSGLDLNDFDFYINPGSATNAASHVVMYDDVSINAQSDNNLSVDNIAKNDAFMVFPNPSNSIVNISNADNMNVNKVTFTDLNGRTVKNVTFDNVSNVQVNVADLASGLYIMNITSNKGTATKKFVKN